ARFAGMKTISRSRPSSRKKPRCCGIDREKRNVRRRTAHAHLLQALRVSIRREAGDRDKRDQQHYGGAVSSFVFRVSSQRPEHRCTLLVGKKLLPRNSQLGT